MYTANLKTNSCNCTHKHSDPIKRIVSYVGRVKCELEVSFSLIRLTVCKWTLDWSSYRSHSFHFQNSAQMGNVKMVEHALLMRPTQTSARGYQRPLTSSVLRATLNTSLSSALCIYSPVI